MELKVSAPVITPNVNDLVVDHHEVFEFIVVFLEGREDEVVDVVGLEVF
jgi:hypothetical protein